MSQHTMSVEFVVGNGGVELYRTTFTSFTTFAELKSVRGKTSGAFRGHGTFQWTAAVRGLSALLVQSALSIGRPSIEPNIMGGAASMAASLDYAISKGPIWMSEMFGTTSGGELLARRLFKRTNPNRKRGGPVVVSINEKMLSFDAIHIFIEHRKIIDEGEISILLDSLQKTVERIPLDLRHSFRQDGDKKMLRDSSKDLSEEERALMKVA